MEEEMLTASCYDGVCSNYNGHCYNAVTKDKRKLLHNTKDKTENKNIQIMRLLYGVGVHITSIGFYYFYDAIHICMNDVLAVTNAQKNIYMVIAERYNVSYKSVERAMRVAFTEAVSMRAVQLFKNEMQIFSDGKGDEMTSIEFICLAAFAVSNSN
ncbi:MAG: hypothetical protein IJZ94_05810 [Clostridia bacterium]|nr:hypothetical protein [Clostridia bacterium]